MREASFEYLGCAGWLIRCGEDAVLTAPFFSNPPLWRLPFPVKPDALMIAKHMGRIAGGVRDVRAVIAGHAHYDHIMDLPVVLKLLPKDVPVIGGPSVRNALGLSGIQCMQGNVCIRPLTSQHAPHFYKWRAFKGRHDRWLKEPPRRPSRWREGEILAFLIEFFDDAGNVLLRVYYNDSAPSYPRGLPPEKSKVDVAILAVASFKWQKGYPREYVDHLNPRHVLLGHWENLFRSADKPMTPVPFTNVQAFIEELNGYDFTLPERHTVISVSY